MSFLLWKWGGWWPSRKTWQCQLTAGRVNNYSQPSQLGSVAKQLPPQSYIICKRNTFFFFFFWQMEHRLSRGQGLFAWCFWSPVDLGEWNMLELAFKPPWPKRMPSSKKGWIWREGSKGDLCNSLLTWNSWGTLAQARLPLWILLRVLVASDLPEDLTKLRAGFGLRGRNYWSTWGFISSWNYPPPWSLRLQTWVK